LIEVFGDTLKYHKRPLYFIMECLDARGLTCPIPLFYVKQRIEGMESGSLLEVFADDEKAKKTIPRWCGMHSHEVLEIVELGECFKILIRKS